jgi:hypothetical protein
VSRYSRTAIGAEPRPRQDQLCSPADLQGYVSVDCEPLDDLESANSAFYDLMTIALTRVDGSKILKRLRKSKDLERVLASLEWSDMQHQEHPASGADARDIVLYLLIHIIPSVQEINHVAPMLVNLGIGRDV